MLCFPNPLGTFIVFFEWSWSSRWGTSTLILPLSYLRTGRRIHNMLSVVSSHSNSIRGPNISLYAVMWLKGWESQKVCLATILEILCSDHPPLFKMCHLLSWALVETESWTVVLKILLNPYLNPKRYSSSCYCPHFTDEETEAQRVFLMCLRSPSFVGVCLVRTSRSSRFRSWSLDEIIRLSLAKRQAQGSAQTRWPAFGTLWVRDGEGISFHFLTQNVGDFPAFHAELEKELGDPAARLFSLISHHFLVCVLLGCKYFTAATVRERAVRGMNLNPLITLQAYYSTVQPRAPHASVLQSKSAAPQSSTRPPPAVGLCLTEGQGAQGQHSE